MAVTYRPSWFTVPWVNGKEKDEGKAHLKKKIRPIKGMFPCEIIKCIQTEKKINTLAKKKREI